MTTSAPWAYVDTSLLALRYTGGADAPHCRRMLRAHRLVTSAITHVELASALARRRDEGDLQEEVYDAALRRLTDDRRYWETVPVSEEVLSRAVDVVRVAHSRTLDSLHLASALLRREAGLPALRFLTRDAGQARAARLLGLDVLGAP